MYLLVFITLMVSIIGLYTQVLGLQASRMAAEQNAFGSAMMQWQTAAISMAASIIKTNAAAYTNILKQQGCSLTFNLPQGVGAYNRCPSPVLIGGGTLVFGTVTSAGTAPTLNIMPNPASGKNECTHLAALCTGNDANGCAPGNCATSYDITNYQFYSILFQDQVTMQNYVVTFVPAPVASAANPPPGFVSLVPVAAGATGMTGFTLSELVRQLNKAGAQNYSYGYFQNFTATPQLKVTGATYNLPNTGLFPNLCNGSATCAANGSLALIGSPDGF